MVRLDSFPWNLRVACRVEASCEAYLTGEFCQFLQETDKPKNNPVNPVDPV